MYRFRAHVQVRYGHFKEYLEVWERMNEVGRSRGWATATFWVPTVGTGNEFIAEIEYPDLATFQRESDAFSSDPEAMTLFRSTAELVIEGTARTELFESAPTLA
jgi:hypothetical protein